MSGGSAPSSPDPVATANAQTQTNIATAGANASLGHTNQSTPFGNLTWTQNGTNPDGTPNWSSQITLDPTQQATLSQQFLNANSLQSGAGTAYTNTINQNAANGYNTSGFAPIVSNVGNAQTGMAQQGSAQQAGVTGAQGWGIQSGLAGAGNLPQQFNNAQQTAFDQQMQYLAPQQADQQNQMQDQLRQQGITQDSNPAAYQHAMDQLNRNSTFQNQQAFDSSYNNGLNSANTIFNQSLGAGNFANAAQQQGFNQNSWNAGQSNNAALTNAQLGTTASMGNAQLGTQASMGNAQMANNMAQFNGTLSNSANAQQYQNMFGLNSAPINNYNALLTGTQVQTPSFQQSQQGNMQAPNIMGLEQSNYQNQMANYNNQQTGMYGMGTSALTMAAIYF